MVSHPSDNNGYLPVTVRAQPHGEDAPSPGPLAKIIGVPLRHWRLFLVWGLLCAVGAVALSLEFGESRWRSEGVLLYAPLPVQEVNKNINVYPTFETLAVLVKSPDNLDQLRQDLGLGVPNEVLDKLIDVKPPGPSTTVSGQHPEALSIALEWTDREEGARLVNRLMDLFIQKIATIRRARLADVAVGLEATLKNCRTRRAQISKSQEKILAQANISELKVALERLRLEITNQEALLESTRRMQISSRAQIEEFERLAAQLRMRKQKDKTKPHKGADETEDKELKHSRKRDRIEEEGKAAELRAMFKAKEAEVERIRSLASKGIRTRTELEKVEAELEGLRARMLVSEKISQWQKEQDQMLRGPGKQSTTLAEKIEDKKLDLTITMKGLQHDVAHVDANLKRKQLKVEQLAEVQKKYDALEKELADVDAERKQTETQLATLHQLQGPGAKEFVVVSQAAPGSDPVGSNHKKVFLIGFLLPMVLLFGLVAAFDWAVRRSSPEAVAEKMGLPILARLTGDRRARRRRQLALAGRDPARGLALRLRQYVCDSGSIILFTPSADGEEAQRLICDLSRYFALRDERVLILDARIAEPPADIPLAAMLPANALQVEEGRFSVQGIPSLENGDGVRSSLVQYFLYKCDKPADLIVPTPLPAVDYMPAGGPYPTTDVFATYRMKELVEALRKQYSMILMVGPSLSHGTDLEILASYVNAIVVVLNNGGKTVPEVDESFESLKEAKAPLLGSVICT